jgi:hypothetical protein
VRGADDHERRRLVHREVVQAVRGGAGADHAPLPGRAGRRFLERVEPALGVLAQDRRHAHGGIAPEVEAVHRGEHERGAGGGGEQAGEPERLEAALGPVDADDDARRGGRGHGGVGHRASW